MIGIIYESLATLARTYQPCRYTIQITELGKILTCES